jgi:hypothetical protein
MQGDAMKRETSRFLRGFSRFSPVAASPVDRRFRCNLVQSATRPMQAVWQPVPRMQYRRHLSTPEEDAHSRPTLPVARTAPASEASALGSAAYGGNTSADAWS